MNRAETLAGAAEAAWEGAGNTGQMRLVGFTAMGGGVLLLVLAFAIARGRRPGPKVLESAAGPVGAPGGAGPELPGLMAAAGGGEWFPGGESGPAPGGESAGRAAPAGRGSAAGDGPAWASDEGGGGTRAEGPGGPPEGGPGVGGGGSPGASEGGSRTASEDSSESEVAVDESAYELLQRGQALMRDRHNAQAAVVLERAARAAPGKGSILEALARAYFNSGQHARAAEMFEALLEIDPSAHYGHFGLGLAFARLGRSKEARTHLRMAVALDPDSATYRRALEKVEARGA